MAGKYHAVAIRSHKPVRCEAVKALEGKVFLSSAAPVLPLAACNRRDLCRCVYKHYDDRRIGPRRDSDIGLPMVAYSNERRARPDRRVSAA